MVDPTPGSAGSASPQAKKKAKRTHPRARASVIQAHQAETTLKLPIPVKIVLRGLNAVRMDGKKYKLILSSGREIVSTTNSKGEAGPSRRIPREGTLLKIEDSEPVRPRKYPGGALLPVLQLRDKTAPPIASVAPEGPLSRGDPRNPLVKQLQLVLKAHGYDLGVTGDGRDGVTGDFEELTALAVKHFQRQHLDYDGNPLQVDAKVDHITADALNRSSVGKWYEEYRTPEALTKGNNEAVVTVTREKIKKLGIAL